MKKIFIIVGKAGAGKTTLCKNLENYFEYKLLSFASIGKKFSNENGFNRIRECYFRMPLSEFKQKISEYMLNIINNELISNEKIIIDGLYIDEIYIKIKENVDCKIIYVDISDNIRYERIAKRLDIDSEKAQIESGIKEKLTGDLGRDLLIENADYVIDGSKSENEVFESAINFIKKY